MMETNEALPWCCPVVLPLDREAQAGRQSHMRCGKGRRATVWLFVLEERGARKDERRWCQVKALV